MKPFIGITMSLEMEKKQFVMKDYTNAVLKAGGIPMVLPYTVDDKVIAEISLKLDGLLLSGGGDIDPTLFEEEPHPGLGEIVPERDEMEIALIGHFMAQKKPILGICRGCQILNVALGGDMIQDLGAQKPDSLQHSQRAPRSHASHMIQIREGSLLHSIYGQTEMKVNSYHHQAVRHAAPSLVATAYAGDGVVEGIESSQGGFVVGVQWHPECMVSKHPEQLLLFQAFVQACAKKAVSSESVK